MRRNSSGLSQQEDRGDEDEAVIEVRGARESGDRESGEGSSRRRSRAGSEIAARGGGAAAGEAADHELARTDSEVARMLANGDLD